MLKLRFLTDDPWWVDLATRYWQFNPEDEKFSNPVRHIAEELHTRSSLVSSALADVCEAYYDSANCPKCGNPAWEFQSRDEYLRFYRGHVRNVTSPVPEKLCNNCNQKEQEEQRDAATRQKQDENQAKIELLQKQKGRIPKTKLSDLSLEQAVFLDAYGRVGLTENFSLLLSLKAIRELKHKLAPDNDNEVDMVRALIKGGLIRLHPNNPPDTLTDIDPDGNFSYYTEFVNFYFPVSVQKPDDPASLFKEIEQAFIAKNWPESWKDQVLPLWQKIALWECLEYLNFVMDEHSLKFVPGDKTLNLLETLLTRFASAQVYNFIWAAGRDAAAFYMRGGVTKAHAANTVVGTIQRMAERAEAQGWEVKKFQRNYRCPQSTISQVFFDAVLKIGDAGFSTTPNELLEEE